MSTPLGQSKPSSPQTTPSDSARRRLFATTTPDNNNDDFVKGLLAQLQQERNEKWGFDFAKQRPLQRDHSPLYIYECLPGESVPLFYRQSSYIEADSTMPNCKYHRRLSPSTAQMEAYGIGSGSGGDSENVDPSLIQLAEVEESFLLMNDTTSSDGSSSASASVLLDSSAEVMMEKCCEAMETEIEGASSNTTNEVKSVPDSRKINKTPKRQPKIRELLPHRKSLQRSVKKSPKKSPTKVGGRKSVGARFAACAQLVLH